ncbi:hypothetical protein JAAARDRAFT_46032 [Jaapia argillacea MUCL 33604]|uniref:Uncharacterized protein n=1 Tax=Jaapia argillacea MUCL 33604 TaxID=933084 RepID=A0A067PZW3_9AGAM|nr:hypothetical protein JAAARDRAFT_46032 [Jaapia argillacea MUCL 33604]
MIMIKIAVPLREQTHKPTVAAASISPSTHYPRLSANSHRSSHPTSNPPHPQLPRCLSADRVIAHDGIRGDAATYHLREIGAHTKALIGEASRRFASLSLGILENVIKTFDNSHNDREIDPSQGVAEYHSVNDDDFFLDSPRSSLTTISYPPSPTPSSLYLDTEGDTTSLVSVNPSPDLVRIGGSEQSLDYCVACQRSFDSTSSIQSGSSRSSDRKRMPTTPAK